MHNTLNEKQKAFVLYAAEVLDASNSEDLDNKLQELSQSDLQGLVTAFDEVYNQKDVVKAELGAKLDFINKLNKKCPEGYEVEKFMSGGQVKSRCKKCDGGKLNRPIPKDKKGSVISDFKKDMVAKNQKGDKVQPKSTYNETEHAKLMKAYSAGKLNPKDLPKLQQYNRTSGHHEDGWKPKGKDNTGKKTVSKKVNLDSKKVSKKLNGGILELKNKNLLSGLKNDKFKL